MTRLVTLSPSVPASGQSLTMKDMVTVGGSIGWAWSGSSTGGSQKVSATVPFDRPAMATMSPASPSRSACARGRGRRGSWRRGRSRPPCRRGRQHLDRLVRLDRAGGDAAGDDAAEEGVGLEQRAEHAERALLDASARGTCLSTRSNSGARPWSFGPSGRVGHPAVAARTVEDREVELLVGGVERGEQVEHLVDDLVERASGRSILLIATIGRRPTFSALPTTNLVCGIGPSAASTSTITPSTIDRMRSTSPPKSAWPGVSTMLMRVSFQTTEVALARIVMPRSFSRSFEVHRRARRRAGCRGRCRTAAAACRRASSCHGRRGR